MKKKITITFPLNLEDYEGLLGEDHAHIKTLIIAMIKGEADFPNKKDIKILVEDK